MAALIEAADDPTFPAEIAGVISNTPDALGLRLRRRRGIQTRRHSRAATSPAGDAHDAAIDTALRELGADIVCLAGYMRAADGALSSRNWEGRLINIHPALLPSFKGLDTHRRALDAGVRIHGCTVHFVTAGDG